MTSLAHARHNPRLRKIPLRLHTADDNRRIHADTSGKHTDLEDATQTPGHTHRLVAGRAQHMGLTGLIASA